MQYYRSLGVDSLAVDFSLLGVYFRHLPVNSGPIKVDFRPLTILIGIPDIPGIVDIPHIPYISSDS